ncbi:hypothetical protein BXZ70DRAFT_1068287 [Cristinia sonorae]|uniref:Uncharacterized protein n=1 Tax=Cristinia sonorae TaxID=1940300 RepID=A0A8K0XKK3_9AGAR|nr:hypothetical protein BXZ70DRAFT_1068287 [Cristinia sonorae]
MPPPRQPIDSPPSRQPIDLSPTDPPTHPPSPSTHRLVPHRPTDPPTHAPSPSTHRLTPLPSTHRLVPHRPTDPPTHPPSRQPIDSSPTDPPTNTIPPARPPHLPTHQLTLTPPVLTTHSPYCAYPPTPPKYTGPLANGNTAHLNGLSPNRVSRPPSRSSRCSSAKNAVVPYSPRSPYFTRRDKRSHPYVRTRRVRTSTPTTCRDVIVSDTVPNNSPTQVNALDAGDNFDIEEVLRALARIRG